jgi:glycerol-3-phosphate dehydrogenase (NAD(P)+)
MASKKFGSVVIIGGGAFSTSIACVLAHNFKTVYIKLRSREVYESILAFRNESYFPGVELPKNIIPLLEWSDLAKTPIELVVSGLPTAVLYHYYLEHQSVVSALLKTGIPFVCLAKGIDTETLYLSDDSYQKIFPHYHNQFCYLSGPSFAREIIEKQITCVSVAGRDPLVLGKVCTMLYTSYFKPFPTYDVRGVLLGGALKNIFAIAGGMLEGLGYNHNTRAAMITRGIEEMLRLGHVINARPETFYGLSGMGDLILTTTGDLSRNKTFGIRVAKGEKPLDIIASQKSVVEGYKTTLAAYRMAKKFNIHTRLIEAVYKVLFEEVPLNHVIQLLMETPVKFGDHYLDLKN